MIIARPRLFGWALVLSTSITFLDQASKFWLFWFVLNDVDEIEVTPFFSLVKRQNLGISFSFLSTDHPMGPWVLAGLALAISVILLIWLMRTADRLAAIGLALIIGGAFGNIIDRIGLGAVQDFLLFHWREWAWPAFNLADSAITVGVGLLLLEGLIVRRRSRPTSGSD